MFDRVEHRAEDENLCVRKWMLDDICDLDRNESWFSDMAEQGLFIDHFGFWSAYFRKGMPHKTRYRMDVLSRKLTEDELSLYDSCGWHFAVLDQETYWNPVYYYIFQTDENATVPELHTDPMEQAQSLRKLHRGSRRDFWLVLAATFIIAGLSVVSRLYSDRRFDYLVNGNVTDAYWFLFYVLELQNSLRRWRNIQRLRKRLAGGEPLDHHADYHAAHRRYLLTAYLKPLLCAAMMAVLLAQLIFASLDYAARPLPEGAPDFPAVRLAEVHDGLDGPNAVCGESYHEWTWAGAVEDRLYEYADDPETGMRLEWYTTCYRLPFAKTADLAFDALLGEPWYRGISDAYWTAAATQVETDLVDEAWEVAPGAENSWQYALYVRDGRYIVTVSYYSDRSTGRTGDATVTETFRDRCTEKILPLLAQRLNG